MAISTETIRKITIQAQGKNDVDALAASMGRLGVANSNLATVTDSTAKRQLSAEAAYKRQTLAVVDGARAQDQMARAAKVVDAALQQGKITAEQAADRMVLLQRKYADTATASNGLATATHGMRGAFELARGAVEVFGVALGGAALVEFGKHIFDTTADLQEQADQVLGSGGNVEAFQAFRAAFLQNNISMENGDKILAHLTLSLGQAADGSALAQNAFKRLQLGSNDLAGQSSDAALPLVAARLLGIKDATARAAVETALFGKTGQQLESALRALAQPMQQQIDMAKQLGIVIDADMIKKADEAKDRMALSWMKLSVSLAPIITSWVDGFSHFTSGIDGATAGFDRMIHKIEALVAVYAGARIGGLFGPLGAVAGGVIGGTAALAMQQDPATIQKSISNLQAQIAAGGSPSEQAERRARLGNYQQQQASLQGPESVIVTPQRFTGSSTAPSWKPSTEDIAAYNKIKETYADFLVSLKEGAVVAGLTTAEQETQSTVIQGAQVYQKEHNVAARDLVRSYEGATAILTKHGLLQGVLTTLDDKRNNLLGRQNAESQDNVDYLNAQIALVGKSNLEQATALALLKEQQTLKQKYGAGFDPAHPTAEQQQALDLAVAQAKAVNDLTVANDNYNISLSGTADLLAEMAGNARDAAAGIADGFGKVGKAIGDAAAGYADYNARQADFAVQQNQIDRDRANGLDITNRQTLLTRKQADAEDQYYADTISGVKNMFGQKTAAFKILSAVEGTYNALRLAGNIEAMFSDAAAVAVKVATVPVHVAANETIAASGVAAGAGQIFAELGPWGFPVVAAMLAVMLGLGFSGGGGGSSSPAIDIAKQRQAGQGAGTILGDQAAKSDSISKSLDQLAKDTNTDLEYSNQMVTSLRSIEHNIGSLTSLLARQLATGGLFDTAGLNLGTSGGNSGILGALVGGLFGNSKTTNTLLDQGIQIAATTIGQAVAGGLSANAYQTVETKKSSSALFGLISSSKTTTAVNATPLSGGFTGGIEDIIGSLRATVLDAAAKLGLAGAQQVVDSFSINLGSISFKDMTGSEIQDTLNQVFSALGDNIAAAAVPQIAQLQQVGEGALETLARLVSEYTAVDDAAKVVGFTFSALGVDSLKARDDLVQVSGGLDQFTSQASFFADNFLTKAQALVPIQQAVANEMARLGEAGVTTKDQFVALVQGLDASTADGAALYAALQNVAPAFAKVADAATTLADQRAKMEITLLSDSGDAVGALALKRQQELAALDASLVPLQNQIYAAEDAATAAAALKTSNDNLATQAAAAQREQEQQAAAAQRVLEQQAQAAAAIASQRQDLQIALLQATGDSVGALALQRQKELDALDASLLPIQNQIYAAQDLAKSFTDLGTGISDLTGKAGQAAQAAQTNADAWGNAFTSLTQASTALLISGPGVSPADQYSAARSQFDTLRSQALGGDASAAAAEANFASQFLQSSYSFNGSTSAYGSDLAYARSTLESLSQFSQTQRNAAQAQADALNDIAAKLNTIEAAIRDGTGVSQGGFDELSEEVKELAGEIAQGNLQARHG